jgi:hypothetical protein
MQPNSKAIVAWVKVSISVLHELPAIAGKPPQKTLNSNAKIGFVWPILNYWLFVGIFLAMR